MTKPYFYFIKYLKVLCFAALCASCKEKPPFIKLNNDEIQKWNAGTLAFLKNCCRENVVEFKLQEYYKVISLNSRMRVLEHMTRLELHQELTHLFYSEKLIIGDSYSSTLWFENDKEKRTFSFWYHYPSDSLNASVKYNNEGEYDYMKNYNWYFQEECCEVYYPSVLSIIHLDKEYNITGIEVEGYMFID